MVTGRMISASSVVKGRETHPGSPGLSAPPETGGAFAVSEADSSPPEIMGAFGPVAVDGFETKAEAEPGIGVQRAALVGGHQLDSAGRKARGGESEEALDSGVRLLSFRHAR